MLGKKKKAPMEHEDILHEFEEKGANVLDKLNHEELLRATALSQACTYYINTIVHNGDLYREMVRDNRVLKPATYLGVVETAISFEAYIRGDLKSTADAILLKKELQGLEKVGESGLEDPNPSKRPEPTSE